MPGAGDGRQSLYAAALPVGERPEPGGEDALRGPDGAARRVWPAAQPEDDLQTAPQAGGRRLQAAVGVSPVFAAAVAEAPTLSGKRFA